MSQTQWDIFIPYTPQDVERFVAAGVADVVVQRIRFERDRQSLFTADIFLYHRQLKRRMVWQFVTLDIRDGSLHLNLPTLFSQLSPDWNHLIAQAVSDALSALQSRADLVQNMIFHADFPTPADVPSLAGGGENRVAPGFAWNELYIHSAKRYLFAAERVRGMHVLDVGCGVGYGAKLLAKRAQQVVAVDVDEYALHYGEMTYPDDRIQRVRVAPISTTQGLPFEDGSFDAVVTFEVIEHIPVEHIEAFFAEIARVTKPEGMLILSTPNKHVYIQYPDPRHVSLMTLDEFRRLLESRYNHVQVLGQVRSRRLPHTAMEFEIVPEPDDAHEILVAVCHDYAGQSRPIALPQPTVWETPTASEQSSRLPISVIVHTRNEEHNIAECLDRVKDWAGEIIVMDMESTDRTVEIARRYTDKVFNHPLIRDFDGARNVSAQHAQGEWILYIDADERVPSALVDALRHMLPQLGDDVSAVCLTYKNYFLGEWIRNAGRWYPGYKAPMLLRRGRFRWNAAAHEGVQVWGRTALFPDDNPDCAIEHYRTRSLDHYLRKMLLYSESTAHAMFSEDLPCSWQTVAAAMGIAFRYYYDETQGYNDGAHGFLLSVAAAMSAMADQMRYMELRLRHGVRDADFLPASAEEFFRFAADVAAGRVQVAQKNLSRILALSSVQEANLNPPAWWSRLWRRLQRRNEGTIACVGVSEQAACDGWRVTGENEQADALVAFGSGWKEAVSRLCHGGSFFIGVPHLPEDVQAWRQEVEQAFDATAHLIDPESNSRWLFAFGWKGQKVPTRRRVLMTTHQRALEMLGGGETQLFETLIALRKHGVVADVSIAMQLPDTIYDLVHAFSLYHGDKIHKLESLSKPLVVSTIFRDERIWYFSALASAAFNQSTTYQVDQALKALKDGRLKLHGADTQTIDEPQHVRALQHRVVERANLILPNGNWEHSSIRRYFRLGYKQSITVPNAVVPDRFARATADAFVQRFGLRDFVLCAARLEPAKNQLMLIWALRNTGIPLVLAGKDSHPEYAQLCRKWADDNVYLLGEIPQDLLVSAYAAARVHAMPSFCETTGLTTLEAAMAGCAVVVGNQGAEPEYFREFAFYCNPADVDSVREAVLRAWEDDDLARREAFRQFILEHYTWDRTAEVTAEAYEQVLTGMRTILAMPDWERGDTWQPVVRQYLEEHQPGDGWLLQLYAGLLNAFSAERAYQMLADYVVAAGHDPENCADIEVIGDLPENLFGRAILVGGRYDTLLQMRYGSQCEPLRRKAA